MNLQLAGKVALVTGSSSGIGAEIARTLAREGATVIVHGRSSAPAEQVAQSTATEVGNAVAVTGDLATDEGADRIASAALAATGAVDILINNAGTYANQGWMESTAEGWAARYNANVLSVVRLVQRLMPQMKARGWGRIIQMARGEATQPFAFMPDYAATKAALVNLTVSLAKELARWDHGEHGQPRNHCHRRGGELLS
jgi:3-oxoacyl-[acyl-carrier protein] reductase